MSQDKEVIEQNAEKEATDVLDEVLNKQSEEAEYFSSEEDETPEDKVPGENSGENQDPPESDSAAEAAPDQKEEGNLPTEEKNGLSSVYATLSQSEPQGNEAEEADKNVDLVENEGTEAVEDIDTEEKEDSEGKGAEDALEGVDVKNNEVEAEDNRKEDDFWKQFEDEKEDSDVEREDDFWKQFEDEKEDADVEREDDFWKQLEEVEESNELDREEGDSGKEYEEDKDDRQEDDLWKQFDEEKQDSEEEKEDDKGDETSDEDDAWSETEDIEAESEFEEARKSCDEEPKDPELEKLRNLSKKQLQLLINQASMDITLTQDKLHLLNMEKEKLERSQCRVLRSPEIDEKLKAINAEILEEKVYLDFLEKRLEKLRKIDCRYNPFPIENLPQVIVCGPWEDNLMPKVVVVHRPKTNSEDKEGLDKAFENFFTKEQMDVIEREKRWVDVECGQLKVQLAKMKGRLRIMRKENGLLRDIATENENEESGVKILTCGIPTRQGNLERTKSCPCPVNYEHEMRKGSSLPRRKSVEGIREEIDTRQKKNCQGMRSCAPCPYDEEVPRKTGEKPELHGKVRGIEKLPCQRRNSKLGRTKSCPMYRDPKPCQMMAIKIDTSGIISSSSEIDLSGIRDVGEELKDIERMTEELEKALEKAKANAATLRAQQEFIECMKGTFGQSQ